MKSKKEIEKPLPIDIVYWKFLETRRGDGKNYTKHIVKILLDCRKNDKWHNGWVRARELKSQINCPESTLFRLLGALREYKIVEKRDRPKHKLTDYRLSEDYPEFYFWTDEEIWADYRRKSDELIKVGLELTRAKRVLSQHDLLEEYEELNKRIKKQIKNGPPVIKSLCPVLPGDIGNKA